MIAGGPRMTIPSAAREQAHRRALALSRPLSIGPSLASRLIRGLCRVPVAPTGVRAGLLPGLTQRPVQAAHTRRNEPMTVDQQAIHDEVRTKYAEAAIAAAAGRTDTEAQAGCCSPSGSIQFGELLYAADERAGLPPAAVLASLGVATRRPSPTSARASACSTSVRAAGST